MRVPVSCCIIVKNDPHLARTVESIRAFVDEVCIVDTGSTDGTAETAARLADRFERFTGCNFEDGEIADFSAARTRSFALASHDTVLWVDSDDVVEGLEHLQEAISWATEKAHGQPWRAKFHYDYDQDDRGRCISWQLRERLVHPKQAFHWVYRVHEGLTAMQATEWQTLEPPQRIVWHHELDKTKLRSRRNLRILRDHLQQVGQDRIDVKTRFDLGQEYAKTGDHRLAMLWFQWYIELSDLPDDQALACLNIVDILCFWPGRDQDAAFWSHKATDFRPEWAEGYWALAKIAYGVANKTKSAEVERRQLRRTAHFARVGLAKAAARTDVPVNPLDRTVNLLAILQDALSRLGDHRGALEAMRGCAAGAPDDPALQLRLRECELAVSPSHALDVAIVCGVTAEAWDPATAARDGLGGSETAVIEISRRLAALGCRVRVYCRCDHPGLYDGVEYRSMGQADAAGGCDLLIAWRNARMLETTPARVKWLWVHDTEIGWGTPWNLALADRVLAVSEWHAEHLRKTHSRMADRIEATRNGIDLSRFAANGAAPRNPHRAIYSSSPDRGLEQLLEMWPRIRVRVPDAELHVYYGFTHFAPEGAAEYQRKVDALADRGVVAHGRVNQNELAEAMLSAGVWVHPSWWGEQKFEETSCIGAMEAQAAGLHIVAGGFGALTENVKHGALIFGDAREPGFQTDFVDAMAEAMLGDTPRAAIQTEARERFGWDDVATAWMARIASDVASVPPLAKTSSRGAYDPRPVLHAILAPLASGDVVMDAAGDPGSESMGGGSRVGFLGLVKGMGALGRYRVRAFSTFKDPVVVRDGVEYIRLDRMAGYTDPDIVFAYYDTSPLAPYGPEVIRIASHHTYAPYMHFASADINTAPSEHAMQVLRERFDPTGQWQVLPNAVGTLDVTRAPVPGRVLYHTSPDRGLHLLLRAYPAIKRAVPSATLHIVGGVQDILDRKAEKGRSGDRPREIQDAYAEAAPLGGITLLGRLPRADLWRELGEASVFAFPCSPTVPCETFSISIAECCKVGLPVVLAPADALESIYAGYVRMTPAPAAEHLDEFADAVVDVLTSERESARLTALGKDLAAQYTFERAAEELDRIITTQSEARRMSAAAE